MTATRRFTARYLTLLLFPCCLSSCQNSMAPAPEIRELTVLYTNDEHGWMEGMEPGMGAANLYELWTRQEGYTPDGPFLVLSGGDNWTGPAISTWTAGESMVEVMNAMHYDASAVGNHEFDFGLEALAARTSEADYPYLSANTRWKDSGEVPLDLGILPYTLKTVNGIRVGIIGLTTRDTPYSTNPDNVSELDFIAYARALRETAPLVRQEDIDLLLVISHVCIADLQPLIRNTADLDIAMVGAGHCNELLAEEVGDTVLLGGGHHFTTYATASFRVNTATGTWTTTAYDTRDNHGGTESSAISSIVSRWAELTNETLDIVIGYNGMTITRESGLLGQAIVDAWLHSDPAADVAITNAGGVRIDLPAGAIDIDTLVAMMPFDNTIVALELGAAELIDVLETGNQPLVAGLENRNGTWVLPDSGEPLDADKSYRVLVNSFMYAGGDGYESLQEADPAGFDTGIHYRQPFQDWLTGLGTTPEAPLYLPR